MLVHGNCVCIYIFISASTSLYLSLSVSVSPCLSLSTHYLSKMVWTQCYVFNKLNPSQNDRLFAENIFNDFFQYKNIYSKLLKLVPESSWESNSADVFQMQLYTIKSLNTPIAYFIYTDIHSSPKVMAVFLFLIFENFLIGGMFSILETIKTDKSTLILQNKNWYQMINPMCATFQMWQNCILQNQVSFERLISLSKTPYIFVKISNPRNWDPYSIFVMSHGNRTSSYETVAHKLRQSVAAVHSSPKVMAVSSNIKMNMLDLLNFYDIYPVHQRHVCLDVVKM